MRRLDTARPIGRNQTILRPAVVPARRATFVALPDAMAKLLNRLGFVYKTPKKVPAKADEAVQRQFVDEVLRPALEAANDDTPLYFGDGTHPSDTAHAARGWIRKGETRELQSNHGRTNVSINGALSWPGREFVHRQTGRITSAEMILLLQDLEARHPTASAIRVVLDNARYNHSEELKAWLARDDCRIEVIYLPPYAPNLNLIERFWWWWPPPSSTGCCTTATSSPYAATATGCARSAAPD